jgi:Transposase
MTEAYDGRQVVGMDLHRQRSVLVRMTEDGRKLETARIANSPAALRAVIARAGENPRVVVEATYGWYWAADTLEAAGAEVHLAHPLGSRRSATGGSRTMSGTARTWRTCCGWGGCRRRGSPRRRCGRCGRSPGTGTSW